MSSGLFWTAYTRFVGTRRRFYFFNTLSIKITLVSCILAAGTNTNKRIKILEYISVLLFVFDPRQVKYFRFHIVITSRSIVN